MHETWQSLVEAGAEERIQMVDSREEIRIVRDLSIAAMSWS